MTRARLYAHVAILLFAAYKSYTLVLDMQNVKTVNTSFLSSRSSWFDIDALVSDDGSDVPATTRSSSSSPIAAATTAYQNAPKTRTSLSTITSTMTSPIVNSDNKPIPLPPPPPSPLLQQQRTRTRVLPHVSTTNDSFRFMADYLYDGQTGSYWLPRPPNDPIGGYVLRETSVFNATNTNILFYRKLYGNRTGFVANTHVNIIMYDGVWGKAGMEGFNGGDFISYMLPPLIAGRSPYLTGFGRRYKRMHAARGGAALAVVGSILQSGPRYTWGPGMVDGKKSVLRDSTQTIFAMRGPRSQQQILRLAKRNHELGRVIPNVVGDMGSFMSWFYQPHDQDQTFQLCIIPHYVDKNSPFIARLQQSMKKDDFKVLDISGPIPVLMDDICKCQFVLSSSLHGIIFADSYQIPNAHLELSKMVHGGGHKFDDYFESVNRTRHVLDGRPNAVNNLTLAEIQAWVQHHQALYRGTPPNLSHLLAYWKACPIHAVAYHNMTRNDQVDFAQRWAMYFDYYMHDNNRPANMLQLEIAMNRALNVSHLLPTLEFG